MHNSKTCQPDGITIDLNPSTCMFKNNGEMISMLKYFSDRYSIELNPKQPLLYINQASGDRIYLPLSCCYIAALPDHIARDRYVMSKLCEYKRSCPYERIKQLNKLIAIMLDNEVLEKHGI